MNKLILSIGGLAVVGIFSAVTNNPALNEGYTVCSSVLLGAVTLGGILKYNSREMQDFREVHREKSKMYLEKIETLKEALIQSEKQIIALNAKLQKQQEAGQLSSIPVACCAEEQSH